MTHSHDARRAGQGTPTSDKADGANVSRVGEQSSGNRTDSQCIGTPSQATEKGEGEAYARAWLERQQAGAAQPGELAVILSFLTGEMLHGACSMIERALGVRHA
jgi:hypothetical protein